METWGPSQREEVVAAVLPLLSSCLDPTPRHPSAVRSCDLMHPALLYYCELYLMPLVTRAADVFDRGAGTDCKVPVAPVATRLELIRTLLSGNGGSRDDHGGVSLVGLVPCFNLYRVACDLSASGTIMQQFASLFLLEWSGDDTVASTSRPSVHLYLAADGPGVRWRELAETIGPMLVLHRENARALTRRDGQRGIRNGPRLYDDVLRLILSYCNYRQLCRYAGLSRGFHELCNQASLWESLYRDKFGPRWGVGVGVGSPNLKRKRKKRPLSLFPEDLLSPAAQRAFVHFHQGSDEWLKGAAAGTGTGGGAGAGTDGSRSNSTASGSVCIATVGIQQYSGPTNSNALPPVCEDCLRNAEKGKNGTPRARLVELCRTAARQHDWKRLFRQRYLDNKGLIRPSDTRLLVDSSGYVTSVCCVIGCGEVLRHRSAVAGHIGDHLAALKRVQVAEDKTKTRKTKAKTKANKAWGQPEPTNNV